MNRTRLVFKPLQYTINDGPPKYVEVVSSEIKTFKAQVEEPTTMSLSRLLLVGIVPPIIAASLGTYIVGGWPTAADTPELRSEKKRVIAGAVITGIAIGTVTALVAKMLPERTA